MGERTDAIDIEIAELLSILDTMTSRDEAASPSNSPAHSDDHAGQLSATSSDSDEGPVPESLVARGRDLAANPSSAPHRVLPGVRNGEPNGLSTALAQLTGMGFVESEARRALLATRRRSIGERQIEQAMQMLLSGEVPDADAPQIHPVYDHSPIGGPYRRRDADQWIDPAAPGEDEFDPSDSAATTQRIDQLMDLVASDDRYRTDEYRTCFRILMEQESVQWRVPQAADWLFSRAGGEDKPLAPVLNSLPVRLRVRAPDPLDMAAADDLSRTGSGAGRNDIVWEWERRGGPLFGMHHHMTGVPMGAHHPDIYDENGQPDSERWGQYDQDAMTMLDIEWAKGEGARGAVLVQSGGSDYLVDLSQMTQVDVEQNGIGMGSPATRRVRRRRIKTEIGPLGVGETLSVMEDPSLSGDMIIVPQSYIEKLDMFTIGRRKRVAVFRLCSGERDTEAPIFIYCRAMEFSGMEGTCAVPTWMARALQIPEFGSGSSARVLVEPWLLPSCGGVKLKSITPGFEELVRAGAAEAADGSFDVTSVLSGPLSRDFCTLTAGSIVPIRCGKGRDVFEFIVTRLQRVQNLEVKEDDAAGHAGSAADASGNLDVEAVDLKSTFNAELALDMSYLTDDVEEIRKVAPNLDDAAAREVLQKAGFDLLAGLKAAEVAGATKAEDDRKHQARTVKALQHLAGVSRSTAESVLAANDWSLPAAQAALAEEAEATGDDAGAELTRGPSNNTLRNRRLQHLMTPSSSGGSGELLAEAATPGEQMTSVDVASPSEPVVDQHRSCVANDAVAENLGDDLSRNPSANTLRNLRLGRLESEAQVESEPGLEVSARDGLCVIDFSDSDMEPEPEDDQAQEHHEEEGAGDDSSELQRLPSANTLRNMRMERFGGGGA